MSTLQRKWLERSNFDMHAPGVVHHLFEIRDISRLEHMATVLDNFPEDSFAVSHGFQLALEGFDRCPFETFFWFKDQDHLLMFKLAV